MVNSRILDIGRYTKGERVENEPSINGESTVKNAMYISFGEYVSAVSKKRRPVTVRNRNLDGELVLEIAKYKNRDNIIADCDLLSFGN